MQLSHDTKLDSDRAITEHVGSNDEFRNIEEGNVQILFNCD